MNTGLSDKDFKGSSLIGRPTINSSVIDLGDTIDKLKVNLQAFSERLETNGMLYPSDPSPENQKANKQETRARIIDNVDINTFKILDIIDLVRELSSRIALD